MAIQSDLEKTKIEHDDSPKSEPSPTSSQQIGTLESFDGKSEADDEKSTSADAPPDGQERTESESPYSVFGTAELRLIVLIAALTTLLPPLTGSMYYPVIPTMARDLHVSNNDIRYTITAYLIVQGIAPAFIGNMSDEVGRRPALIVAFVIYIAGCIGAAFRNNYALLLVMRCVQSAGSSGTIAMSLATISDIVTSAQRGSYTSYVQMGWMVGPAIGPVIGGLLAQHLGWRSIFWFLTIFSSTVFITLLLFMPETSRAIVGNGSIPSPKWNQPFITLLRNTRKPQCSIEAALDGRSMQLSAQSKKAAKFRISPYGSLKLFGEKETCLLLLYSGMIYASSYVVVSTLPTQLQTYHGLDIVQTSLCYLATGLGTMASVLATGRFLDWNFRRHANRLGVEISRKKQQDLQNFPIETARLQITFPLLIVAGASLLAYGWTMQARTNLAVPLTFLFLQSFGIASSFSGLNNLLMDLNRKSPGAASAAMNLSRCWIGAGGVALGGLLNEVGGPGWMTVTITGIWLIFSPLVVVVMRCGPTWRAGK